MLLRKDFIPLSRALLLRKTADFRHFFFIAAAISAIFQAKLLFILASYWGSSLYQKCIVTKQNLRLDFRLFRYFLPLSRNFIVYYSILRIVKMLFVNLICWSLFLLQKESTSLHLQWLFIRCIYLLHWKTQCKC